MSDFGWQADSNATTLLAQEKRFPEPCVRKNELLPKQSLDPVMGRALGRLLFLPLLLMISGCAKYELKDAVVDQKSFNLAFKHSDRRSMSEALTRFGRGVSEDRFVRRDMSYCSQDVHNGLQYEAHALQKIAVGWVRDKSARNAIESHDQVGEQEKKLLGRIKNCKKSEISALKGLFELIELVRDDIRKTFDLEVLREAQRASHAKLVAQRLASCDLEDWRQKAVFQHFVRLEDIYGLAGRKRVIREVAQNYNIAESCVDQTARNATYDHPEWVPEPR